MNDKGPSVAFFGATGDCAGYCLAAALQGGFKCSALARSPEKLINSLSAKGVDRQAIDAQLHIVSGNVKDEEALKRTLRPNGERIVDQIVSGIGGTPVTQWSLTKPVTLNDPTICQDAGKTILQALEGLKSDKKPFFINVSTTGIPPNGCPRDVPLFFVPLYHWLLAVPHADKKVLEDNLASHMKIPKDERAIQGYVNVRPSLLMDGEAKGVQSLREGVDKKPAVGYTIRRQDVGRWMFERLVKQGVKAEWVNQGVTITY